MLPMPTILVVDDEPNYLIVLSELLRDENFEVYTAPGTDDAMAIVKEVDLDLVITDMTMPGLTGDHVVRDVSTRRPGLPIIMCTGFSEIITKEKVLGMGSAS